LRTINQAKLEPEDIIELERLVWKFITQYKKPYFSIEHREDMKQEILSHLVNKSVAGYNPEKGPFTSYIYRCIMNKLRKCVVNYYRKNRIPLVSLSCPEEGLELVSLEEYFDGTHQKEERESKVDALPALLLKDDFFTRQEKMVVRLYMEDPYSTQRQIREKIKEESFPPIWEILSSVRKKLKKVDFSSL
jgi:RNA polymerase sigma factor (sigma-70 family)